jgi:N-acetylneuraminic acid mutarotase
VRAITSSRAATPQPAFLLLAAASLLALSGCTTASVPNTTAPFFLPAAGTYTSAINVSIGHSNPQAIIHYTIDGSLPSADSPVYTGTMQISATTTIQTIAVLNPQLAGPIASATYNIALTPAAAPTFAPPAGTYATPQTVTLADSTPAATIYYTTDGSSPSTASTVYTTPLSVAQTETLSAVAIAPNYSLSPVATAEYTIGAGFGTWTWMGDQGSSNNCPQARAYASSWTDPSGNFWLFGGETQFPHGNFMADLWEYSTSTLGWTHVSGTLTPNQAVSHLGAGVADPSNNPGGRSGAVTWADAAGNLWLFGGEYTLSNGQGYYLNDLWKFTPSTGLWTWYSGDYVQFPLGVYGIPRSTASVNTPGGRSGGASWTDAAGNLWLFGGEGVGATLSTGELNDLWEYSPSLNQWSWVGGSSSVSPLAVYGTQGTASSSTTPGGLAYEASAADSTHRLFAFGGIGETASAYGQALNALWQYDPSTSQWTWIDGSTTSSAAGVFGAKGVAAAANIPTGRMYTYTWADPTGNLWVFAGNIANGNYGNDLWKFDSVKAQWAWMNGSQLSSASSNLGQLGVPDPANVPGGRCCGVTWVDKSGALWFFGGATNTSFLSELWRYQP